MTENNNKAKLMNDIVLQNLDQGLLTITMNRPERRNALNPDMTRGLVEAARRAAEDHEVRAVLLKGAGGTFCVGGDVKSMAEGSAPLPFEAKMANLRRGMEVSRILHRCRSRWWRSSTAPPPAPGCRWRWPAIFASPRPRSRSPPRSPRSAMSGDYGGTYFLTQLLGSAKARELYLLSPVLTAQEALALGMVTRVVARRRGRRGRARAGDVAGAGAVDHAGLHQEATSTTPSTLSLEACFDAEAMHHSRCRRDRRPQGSRARPSSRSASRVFKGH